MANKQQTRGGGLANNEGLGEYKLSSIYTGSDSVVAFMWEDENTGPLWLISSM